ncbi:hypothetical protein [Pseudomonas sp. NPDC086278]|uniref:hypothetical protein n=1 Tax=Pseudomonas sp. NPDC086278 TaxID=3390646 RepID=UPI003D00CE62
MLIADKNKFQCVTIERSLRALGYHAIASVLSFRELLSLTHYSCEPFEHFDLLIINGEMLASAGADPYRFFVSNSQVRHGLIHDARRGQQQPEVLYSHGQRNLSLVRTADQQSISDFLQGLDGWSARQRIYS